MTGPSMPACTVNKCVVTNARCESYSCRSRLRGPVDPIGPKDGSPAMSTSERREGENLHARNHPLDGSGCEDDGGVP